MKKLFFLFILVAQQSFATTHTVTITGGDNRTNITNAISGLVDFDTLYFPACSAYVAHPTITITVKIKIIGVDTSNTILYRSSSSTDGNLLNVPFFTFDGSSWNLAPSGVKVQGIKFKSKEPSIDDAGADGKSIALDQALRFDYVSSFEVKDCSFWWLGNGAVYVNHRDYFARGLIHNSGFIWNAKGASGLGYGYGVVIYGENNQWIPYINNTDGNSIVIEDCVFKFHSHSIAAGGCANYTSRYNDFWNSIISENESKHALDAHGQQGNGGDLGSDNYFSTRIMISHNDSVRNTLFFDRTAYISNGSTTLSRPMERLLLSRGGELIVHDNYFYGGRFACSISYDGSAWAYPYLFGQGYASGLTYPSTHTGTSPSQSYGDTFIWNISYSVYDGSNGDGTMFYNYKTSDFLNNRDYHQSTNSSAAKINYTDIPYPYVNHY